MKPNLYICHTAYQVLVDLLRAGRAEGGPHTMVLSAAVADAEALAVRLDKTGVVQTVLVDETRWPGTVTGPLAALRARRAFEKLCGWKLDRGRYENVYIHNDWSVLGRYLQDCHAGYILCEDTFGSTLGPDQHLVTDQRAAPDFAQKQNSGKGYLYWGDSPWCKLVESEDASRCTLFGPEKLVTDSKGALLQSLTDAEKAMVRTVFLTQPLPEQAEGATLLLPRSFVADGLMTQEHQDAMFRAVAARYAVGPLFIKTHPRDTTDYQALFPDAVILERTMPSEVLNFCLPFTFRRAVTVQSFVLRGFTAAEEKILLTLEEAQALISQ
ncbi:glycosyltransferase family 52 [Subdoligranulum variabile]|uniref:Lipooligosaccharide sialyltransferase (LST) n=1 Tax=Subdoligranulum variabile DSM 15176 TaxID=411471 RepID=D1PP38_9FIRM|nr:glycosyltransferase family 52 [Subdoligranulum variabile]EFB75534.1 lipooligosaccharide sialyltransferase (LST) [Subdoligranulum variabile DSM 15176]UWP68980.1 glycosyltransferase family 52 protein [Subdoligranulum variabile]